MCGNIKINNALDRYYPFGMVTPRRSFSAGDGYRFGFNGKESDAETYGSGNIYDYGFRIYNPRLGKFLSVDPLTRNYPNLTPYQFASNRPIDGLDLDGLEYIHFIMYEQINEDGSSTWIGGYIDYRNMTDDQIREVHGMSPEKFYRKYSESFGPEGQGVKWTYYYADGEVYEPWEQDQRDFKGGIGYYGLYSGEGSITLKGPIVKHQGPNTLGKPLKNKYDFTYEPIDYPDSVSKLHDIMQSSVVDNQGWGEDSRHLESNYLLLTLVELSPEGMSKEAIQRVRRMNYLFEAVVEYNLWKSEWLEKNGYDSKSAYDQQYVSLRNWRTVPFSKESRYKYRLIIAGAGKSKKEMSSYWEKKEVQ